LGRFPKWLHRSLPKGGGLWKTEGVMRENRLHTVCEEAKCPNILDCWSRKTATFLILGKQCTRNCGFCDIAFTQTPPPVDVEEPTRVAESVAQLGLKHVVITMVARDDLSDGGAEHVASTVKAIRKLHPQTTIELLTSDFSGNLSSLDLIIECEPDIFNHNIETVRELTPRVRHKATYDRTLSVLNYVKTKNKKIWVKSGLMVGFSETENQVYHTIDDLKETGCDIVTIGQYLQASRRKLLVKAFVTPEQFGKYAEYGRRIGIQHMYCGPFVRSSYNADIILNNLKKSEEKL
jgi:lipoic acid synthetase